MKRTGRLRRKTRHKMQKDVRRKGKISLTRYFQEFKDGDRVGFAAEPAVQTGVYPRRYHGNAGLVVGKRGTCYIVQVKERKMMKSFIVHPVHLKRLQ